MSKTVITKKELSVPVAAIIEVADVLLENDIINDIVGTEPHREELVIEVQYGKEQRDIIHQVEDIIADYEESDGEEEDEEADGK